MSVWRLEIDMAFKEEDDMVALLNLIEQSFDKLAEKKTGEFHIKQNVRYHECMHDVGGSCGNYTKIEFDGEKEHKNTSGKVIKPLEVKQKEESTGPTGDTGPTGGTI
jgi:hypothetical protein